jgi:hypothetical protein
MPDRMSREAVALFHDERSLQRAVDELLISGFDRSAISLLAGQQLVETTLHRSYKRVGELEDDVSVPRIHYIGTDSRTEAKGAVIGGFVYVGAVASAGVVLSSGGTALAAVLGVAIAGGVAGLMGAAFAQWIGRHHARYLRAHLDKGGLVLWVAVANPDQERRAEEILTQHAAEDVHILQRPVADYATFGGGVSYDLSFMKQLGL